MAKNIKTYQNKKSFKFLDIVKSFVISFVGIVFFFLPLGTANALGSIGSINDIRNQSPIASPGQINSLIQRVFQLAIVVAGVATVGYIVYGGYMIIFSEGDQNNFKVGQSAIINGIIGLVIVALAGLIFDFVIKRVLGVDAGIFNLPF